MNELEKAIRDFHDRVSEAELSLDAMNETLSMAPESKLCTAIWALVGAYKDALGKAYGIEGWLEWWWLECRLGQNPLKAAVSGEQLRTISTVDDLVALILDDLAQSA